jgi:hypothetical protein
MPAAAMLIPVAIGVAGAGIAAASGAGKVKGGATAPRIDENAYQWGGSAAMQNDEFLRNRRAALDAFEGRGITANYQDANMARDQQNAALGMYAAAARGEGPSAAQAAGNAAMGRAASEQASMAASARGGALAQSGAQLAAMNNMASASGQIAGQTAIARAQEQQAAMAGYGGLAGAMRSADAQQAQYDAQAKMAQTQFWEQQARGLNDSQMAANMSREQARQNNERWEQTANLNIQQGNAAVDAQNLNRGIGAVQGAGSAAGMMGVGGK